MKNILRILLLFTFVITAVIPCSALELLERDHGHDFTIDLGEELAIRLPGNPTTGYLWEVAANDTAVLKQKGETAFVADADRIGAGGQSIFRFVPCGVGSTRLKLVYRRPWEKEIQPIKVFEVVVTVKQA
ncbi:MAG: protease inhibitor I42 family protein [Deltaproteobacteria bacterium]|nr:protease inhibitor I42 family protein [Deltaproteobacteria bacterium]